MDQSMFGSFSFIPGIGIEHPEPLSRYLPQIPDGVVSTWLLKNIPPGSWILDPFGASPRLIVEAARVGYKLLVTANNPIARFLLEMAATPSNTDDLKYALAELASSYKADERMEPHIRSLYNTQCARCGQIISADAFLWEHGSQSPYIRIYTCPFCGDSGEHPCGPYDAEVVSQFSSSGLHKARALERVVAATDQDRIHVEQALSVYIPRALYALITIINKIEGLEISSTGQKHLAALLLYAFDQGTAMWRTTGQRERRRQLTIPRYFRENNIWLALEQGISIWSVGNPLISTSKVPIFIWPEEPPEGGGICVHEGRLISIAETITKVNIKAVCTAVPRPSQAFWTLSALWAGWLWGREAVGSFKSVLHRQRYDWGWHTTALTTIFKQLTNILEPSTPIFGLLSESEPGFIASVLAAARIAGCGLKGIATRPEEELTQILWNSNLESLPTDKNISPIDLGIQSAKIYLESRGEPASYLNTISAAFLNILLSASIWQEQQRQDKNLSHEVQSKISETSEQNEPTPSLVYSKMYNSAREALSYRSGFLQFNLQESHPVESASRNQAIQGSLFAVEIENKNSVEDETQDILPADSESGPGLEKERPTRSSDISESTLLWLREINNISHVSLTDRIELALVDYLNSRTDCTVDEISKVMCEMFPGLYTPDPEFIHICLESYGEKIAEDGSLWQIRQEDKSNARKIDIDLAHRFIHQIAERLNISCTDQALSGDRSIISWLDPDGEYNYKFFTTITAAIGGIILNEEYINKGIIVLPGSRANLVVYKLQRDPRLSKALNTSLGNWQCLKFRHLKSIAENPLLSRENLDHLLLLDPLTYSTPQLRLI
jgi:hypothetical protein